jgi:hypothetical protein
MRNSYLIPALICILAMSPVRQSLAACSNDMDGNPGQAGDIEYFTSTNKLMYCDDTNWVEMTHPVSTGRIAFGGESHQRVVFLTGNDNGVKGGITGADAQCQAYATSAGLRGVYFSWLADSTAASAPATRFEKPSVPYVLVTGTKVADDWTDLTDGTLDNAIRLLATGTNPGSTNSVFTNVNTDGTQNSAVNHCSDWTSNVGSADGGDRRNATSTWTISQGTTCASSLRLYCFEQWSSPVARWKMDETSGTTIADSIGSATGNMQGGMTADAKTVQGRVNNALSFADGATTGHRITVANTAATQNIFDTGGTVAFWTYPFSDGQTLSRWLDKNSVWQISTRGSSSPAGETGIAFYHSWSGASGVHWRADSTTPPINLNEWNHIAVVYDADAVGNNPTIYVNGTAVSLAEISGPPSGTRGASTGTMYIGTNAALATYSDSLMDDIRFYDRSLSAAEITQVYLDGCGRAGEYSYEFLTDTMRWCDGTRSYNMGPPDAGGNNTCTGSEAFTGQQGALNYFSALSNTYYQCNGLTWVPIGRGCTECGGSGTKKVAFVASRQVNGAGIGGMTGADSKCQTAANAGGLAGTYMAWIADSTAANAPATRFSAAIKGGSYSIVRTDGTQVADSWADLIDGSIDAIISHNEFGQLLNSHVSNSPYTNVANDGTQLSATNHCADLTAGTGNIRRGNINSTTNWTSDADLSCGGSSHIYCFEQ